MFAVGPETAQLLNTLIHATRAAQVLEIGQLIPLANGLEITIWLG
jgi:hypothetical protein